MSSTCSRKVYIFCICWDESERDDGTYVQTFGTTIKYCHENRPSTAEMVWSPKP
jgi:hypothetical protein